MSDYASGAALRLLLGFALIPAGGALDMVGIGMWDVGQNAAANGQAQTMDGFSPRQEKGYAALAVVLGSAAMVGGFAIIDDYD